MIDWDDLRYFLAVARTGSTLGAARSLGVNQTTAARRIGLLEEKLGAGLFERHHGGYRLVSGTEELVDVATRAEGEIERFTALATARGRDATGSIKVTTNEPLANVVLAPVLREFRKSHPNVRVDIVISPRQLDLAHGEADVALRAAPKPTDPCLVARRVGDANWGAYCSRDYAALHGCPKTLSDLGGHTILTIADASGSRLAEMAGTARSVERRETINDLCVAVRAGVGIASLPCVFGDTFPDFIRCFVQEEPVTPVWLVYHERLRGVAHIRKFLDFTVAHTIAARDRLLGQISPAASNEA